MESKGCTANVLMLVSNLFICANAGDSRCVLGEQGKAVPLSFDHKPNLKKERERIYKAGSTVNSYRMVTNLDHVLMFTKLIVTIAYFKGP